MRAYLRFDAFSPDHEKVCVRLPNDAARWSWVVVLCKGKLQRPQGRWGSVSHVVANSGRPKAHIEAMIAAGLLDVADDGSVTVHGWDDWQSNGPEDPTNALRQKRHRDKTRAVTALLSRSNVPVTNGQTETETEIPPTPLPEQPKPATKPEADPPIPPVLRFAKFWKDEYEFAGHGMYHWTPKDAVVAEGLISSFGVPDENPDLAERVRMFMADQDDYVRRRRQTWIFETRVNDYKPGKSERSAVPSVEETKATIARISKPGKPVMPPGKTG